MLTVLSLVTSVKDYIEIAHKLIESQNGDFLFGLNANQAQPFISAFGADINQNDTSMFFSADGAKDYTEFGAVLTYLVLSVKEFLTSFLSFTWFNQIWSLPLIVPDIASAMISEVSVLDSYFTNAFSFLETGLSSNLTDGTAIGGTSANTFVFGFEKFITGLLNSFFLFLPTSTAHLITVRRFVIQGLEAGYIAGLGTIAGNVLWLASIIFGWRFIVIPWLSFDIFRYILGFSLLVKYLWDSSKEFNKTNAPSAQQTILEENTKKSIFLLNFLLALTEQTSIYPFISNMSFGAEGSILESFSAIGGANVVGFGAIMSAYGGHVCYLLGILLGSFSLLQFTVWFWENPAFSIYMWIKGASFGGPMKSYRITTSAYYKILNFIFLYLTMLCAISSIPYFGLDYTVTNPLGLIPQDRIIDQKFTTANGPNPPTSDKILQETAFLGVNPTDKNTRIRDGIHARRERWKERLIKYQAFDASLYDQGKYDILTMEDLNYGFDRFWLRRKMRNHQIRFRLFPGPWMRSLKKQLNKPGFSGPRVEFFRILFEQYYHPIFHATVSGPTAKTKNFQKSNISGITQQPGTTKAQTGFRGAHDDVARTLPSLFAYGPAGGGTTNKTESKSSIYAIQKDLVLAGGQYSSFTPSGDKGTTQTPNSALRKFSRNFNNRLNTSLITLTSAERQANTTPIYSKSLKSLYSKINKEYPTEKRNLFRNISRGLLHDGFAVGNKNQSLKKTNIRKKLSKKERLLLTYKMDLYNNGLTPSKSAVGGLEKNLTGPNSILGRPFGSSLEPLKYYLQKDEAFKRKLKYYSTTVVRNLSVGNNAPYFKTMLKRAFYYHKPSLRWKRTMFTAALRRGFRKKSSRPKKLVYTTNTLSMDTASSKSTADKAQTVNKFIPEMQTSNGLQNPIFTKTSSYSVLGKRASRYRYQIYKDVLQHWYYSPFNRLLLKFDIDSFINRQPKSHFLTRKEERLLHLRRLLLSEHYHSLRWYTYMQHYRTMKSTASGGIGGTKSFSSTVYNQQFQGTFKKIRHLFSITPIQGDMPILQFDQPLYNPPTAAPFLLSTYFHEENVASERSNNLETNNSSMGQKPLTNQNNPTRTFGGKGGTLPEDLIEQSLNITGEYLKTEQSNTQEKIKQYINSKNYAELSKLLVLKDLNLSDLDTNIGSDSTIKSASAGAIYTKDTKEILLRLLKECKRRLNDQAFLKNYITHRLDKRELRNNEVQTELQNQLESFQNWLSPISINVLPYPSKADGTQNLEKSATQKLLMQTTGVRKALNESVFVLNNINPATSRGLKEMVGALRAPNNSKNYLSAGPEAQLAIIQKEEQIKQTLQSIKSVALANMSSNAVGGYSKTKGPFSFASKGQNVIYNLLKPILVTLRAKSVLLIKQNNVLAARAHKNIEWWRQKQRVMTKRKSSRKKARFKNIKASVEQNAKVAQSSFSFDPPSQTKLAPLYTPMADNTLRKKRASTVSGYNSLYGSENQNSMPLWDIADRGNDSIKSNPPKAEKSGPLNKLFKTLFLNKLNTFTAFSSKRSSKGSRYRNMSNNRGFAFVRRPKNDISNSLDIPLDASLSKDNKRLVFQEALKQKLNSSSLAQNLNGFGYTQNQENTKASQNKGFYLHKKSPIQKRAKRTWKKRNRHKFTKNHYKYRKRNIHGFGKLRNLNKKVKRIKAIQELQNWWWNIYLPNYLSKANGFAVGNVGYVDVRSASPSKQSAVGLAATQINPNIPDKYKPLSTKQALDIRQNLLNPYQTSNSNLVNKSLVGSGDLLMSETNNIKMGITAQNSTSINVLDQMYSNAFGQTLNPPLAGAPAQAVLEKNATSFLQNYNTTSIPFYAGWDDSLRKFVVTNRLLSRRDTGFRFDLNALGLSSFSAFGSGLPAEHATHNGKLPPVTQKQPLDTPPAYVEFTKAPIQGLNEGSFLYLQTPEGQMPFNSYIIDQFIPNNQSFYAPLGWKRFQFRHSLLKNWHAYGPEAHKQSLNSKNYHSNGNIWASNKSNKNTSAGPLPIFLKNNSLTNLSYFNTPEKRALNTKPIINKNVKILQNKRIKKRYKLLKQTPIQLMYVPTGALLNDILPSHYISVFDKQYRIPRNRYIKRYLPKAKGSMRTVEPNTPSSITNPDGTKSTAGGSIKDLTLLEYSNSNKAMYMSATGAMDFTLRKKLKPRRKYHKKRFTKKDGLIFPRRQKFTKPTAMLSNLSLTAEASLDSTTEGFRLRPSTKAKQTSSFVQKTKSKKRVPRTLRLRQLRNREFKQVYKPLQRFEPRSGGFVWPGDYLRFEIVPMPKLKTSALSAQGNIQPNISATETKSSSGTLAPPSTVDKGLQPQQKNKVKRKINVQPVGLLPRKYLLEKHNLKVLKKKLALSSL